MRTRPIVFDGPAVRAILCGRKTQARRILKPQPEVTYGAGRFIGRAGHPDEYVTLSGSKATEDDWQRWRGKASRSPFGVPGDRLWVRETWAMPHGFDLADQLPDGMKVKFKASDNQNSFYWRSSVTMPRWASRITLEVTNIWLERIQELTEEDAIAEGAWPGLGESPYVDGFISPWVCKNGLGSWDSNPWVWALTFRRIEQ